MTDLWIDITNIPVESGREFAFTESDIWTGPWAEFGLPYRMVSPIQANLNVLPQKTGCLVRGVMTGTVGAPCSRCSEDVRIDINTRIDVFAQDATQAGHDADEFLLRREGGKVELNVGALLWEEFELAMPVKPLCGDDCKGLCPHCGQNLNDGECSCEETPVDSRLAVLKNIKIH